MLWEGRVLRACENEGVLCLAGASMARVRLTPTLMRDITNTSSIRTDREDG